MAEDVGGDELGTPARMPAGLAVVEGAEVGVVADGALGGLCEGGLEVGVALLGSTTGLGVASGIGGAWDEAAVGAVVASGGEAGHVPGLVEDDGGEGLAEARDLHEVRVAVLARDGLKDEYLDGGDLIGEERDAVELLSGEEPCGGLLEEDVQVLDRPGLGGVAGVMGQAVLVEPKAEGRVGVAAVGDQAGALPDEVPDGAGLLGIDVGEGSIPVVQDLGEG